MERLHFTLNAPARRAKLAGRDYLVSPVVMLVPGVLNGSKGPLYYPHDEVATNVDAWNGMPLTQYHPTDDAGRPASGRHPAVIERHGLGTVFNAHIRQTDGALVGEGWFDVQEVQRKDANLPQHARLYPRLLTGKPIEVSTGLFTQNQPARPGAVYNGRPYAYVARNYKPDHLAILPDQTGACSVADGCGVAVHNRRTPVSRIATLIDNAKKGSGKSGWVTLDGGQHVRVEGGKLQFGRTASKMAPGTKVSIHKTVTKGEKGKSVPHPHAGKSGTVVEHHPESGSVKVKLEGGGTVMMDHKHVQASHPPIAASKTTFASDMTPGMKDNLKKMQEHLKKGGSFSAGGATPEKLADHAAATAAKFRRKAMKTKDPVEKKQHLKDAATFEAVAAKHRKKIKVH